MDTPVLLYEDILTNFPPPLHLKALYDDDDIDNTRDIQCSRGGIDVLREARGGEGRIPYLVD